MGLQRTVLTVLTVLTVVLAVLAVPAPAATRTTAASPDAPVVRMADGALRGSVDAGVATFRGVPYAAPPVGDLRWRSPRPALSWTGVRPAVEPGPRCPQRTGGAEDCLYLEVQAPWRARGRVPVVVFVHGGGFVSGTGADHDASRLVRQGGVVAVTVNYRLGALGFLDHPGATDPAAGNYGLADQQAALRWVRRNIAAFGGDPAAVTLWGQSAGAVSVCAQVAASASPRLFHRAIVQSGPCGNAALDRPTARDRATAFAATLGCDTLACLRAAPAGAVVAASPPDPPLPVRSTDRPWLPVAGTPLLPQFPVARPDIPLLQGATRDEMAGFVARNPVGYPDAVRQIYGPHADDVLRRYPADAYASPAAALTAVLSDDGSFLGTCRQHAGTATRYAYEFAEPAGPLGAYHTTDLRYLLDSRDDGPYAPPPLTDAERPLADTMVRHWATFIRTGHPGPGWPRYDGRHTLSFSAAAVTVVDAGAAHGCDFWRTRRPV